MRIRYKPHNQQECLPEALAVGIQNFSKFLKGTNLINWVATLRSQ